MTGEGSQPSFIPPYSPPLWPALGPLTLTLMTKHHRPTRKHLIATNRMIPNAKALGVWSSLDLEGNALQDMAHTADIRSLSGRELETYRGLMLRFHRVMDGPSQPSDQVNGQELLH